jgi:iron complex outermembrane receptor protein
MPVKPNWLLKCRFSLLIVAFGVCLPGVIAQTNLSQNSSNALKNLSLEALMNVDITTVSRRPEPYLQAPAAIQIITQDDIHRSGATSIAEALRLAPNLEVAQVKSHDWAISSRGFNNNIANKLLVMIDGRNIYTPLYAGVFWDAQQVLLEDVDRIEIVSGPGGTLWGANAVNGVINIVTKSARDTQGLYVSGAAGTSLQDYGAVRYGGMLTSNLYYRAYLERYDRNGTQTPSGGTFPDRWNITQGGFRMDYYPSTSDVMTLQGDGYGGAEGHSALTNINGQNIIGRWSRSISPESDWQLQAYFDRTWRRTPLSFSEDLRTYDLDFQDRFEVGQRNNVLWGAGYRLYEDHTASFGALHILPPDRHLQLFSGFLQDELTLVPDKLKFTFGSKLEHNDFSGWEFQPSGRLSWMLSSKQTIWAAVSRAVRSPSRIDSDVSITVPGLTLRSDPDFDSEKVNALELGYRIEPRTNVSLAISTFYNIYDQLRSVNTNSDGTLLLANNFQGETAGVELSGDYTPLEGWRLRGGYTYLYRHLTTDGTAGVAPSVREGNDPEHQILIQSMLDLPMHLQFDCVGRYVNRLTDPRVPAYLTADVRLAWEFQRGFELSLVGQNLAGPHVEFSSGVLSSDIPRSFYAMLSYRH